MNLAWCVQLLAECFLGEENQVRNRFYEDDSHSSWTRSDKLAMMLAGRRIVALRCRICNKWNRWNWLSINLYFILLQASWLVRSISNVSESRRHSTIACLHWKYSKLIWEHSLPIILLAAQSSIDKIEFSTGRMVEGGVERAIDLLYKGHGNCSTKFFEQARSSRTCWWWVIVSLQKGSSLDCSLHFFVLYNPIQGLSDSLLPEDYCGDYLHRIHRIIP